MNIEKWERRERRRNKNRMFKMDGRRFGELVDNSRKNNRKRNKKSKRNRRG